MAGILWMLCLSLLVQQSFCSLENGCAKWRQAENNEDVCCDECHQGHRLVKECGKDPEKLCTRCELGTFTTQPKAKQCMSCRQCVGAHVTVKSCTKSSNTVCGCKEGLRCEDKACNFCVTECGKGEQPNGRSCSPCPEGTFNDQIHEKCKPWSKKCPNPDQEIIASGNAVSDIKCTNISVCGCKEGLRCGDKACNRCVTECGKGEEPNGCSCRPCPEGTFNDQIHKKCKPWSKKCPNPDQEITAPGNAVSDIKCDISVKQIWPLMLPVVFGVVLICIIIILVWKAQKRRQTKEIQEETGEILSKKIPGPPSDDPRTLIAIECSFHEAQQEQGSSCESLASKDSSEQLLPSNNINGKN